MADDKKPDKDKDKPEHPDQAEGPPITTQGGGTGDPPGGGGGGGNKP